MTDLADRWAKALAFDAEHGEAGPEVLAKMLAEHQQAADTKQVEELQALALLLEQLHRAGSQNSN